MWSALLPANRPTPGSPAGARRAGAMIPRTGPETQPAPFPGPPFSPPLAHAATISCFWLETAPRRVAVKQVPQGLQVRALLQEPFYLLIMLSSSSGPGFRGLNPEIAGSNPADSTKFY